MATFFNLAPRKGFVWKQSFINRTTRGATEGTLRVYSEGGPKKEPFCPRIYIAPSLIIRLIFS